MRNQIMVEWLKDQNTDTIWLDKAMTTAVGTYTSEKIPARASTGQTALLVKTSAGSLRITYQLSLDGNNWYEPKNSTGTTVNSVRTNLAADAWQIFTPQIAEWMRFKFVLTGANSTVSARYIQQEEA